MNFWMDHFLEDLKDSLTEVDVLTINDEEAVNYRENGL